MVKRVVIYARISAISEESVSVARQLRSSRQYAAARDWTVVGEYVDEGVSATRIKPSERTGWAALLRSSEPYEAVIVWKVDRLARRVLDFLQTDELLQSRGAALVCVEQSIDMTTGDGRAFAQMLAVFGEMEAAMISSRIKAARAHLIAVGRAPGGLQPYGWRLVPNPDGAGVVRAQDPERIGWVRGMVDAALEGQTVNAITAWLNAAGPPAPRSRPAGRAWGYSSVDRLLRNPVLAGMTPCNPGFEQRGVRGPEVRRDDLGRPVVSDDGILSLSDWERLQQLITHKAHHAAIPRDQRRRSSPLLAMLAKCAGCQVPMTRHQGGQQFFFRCPKCGQCISRQGLTSYIERRLLSERGSRPTFKQNWVIPDDPRASHRLASIDDALRRVALEMTNEGVDIADLNRELTRLKSMRRSVRQRADGNPHEVLTVTDRTVAQVWALCASDEQRRAILDTQIESLTISRSSRGGRYMDTGRIALEWAERARQLMPAGVSLDPAHHPLPTASPWISIADAQALAGCSEHTIRTAVEAGLIERRHVHRVHPSISRESVEAYAAAGSSGHRRESVSGRGRRP